MVLARNDIVFLTEFLAVSVVEMWLWIFQNKIKMSDPLNIFSPIFVIKILLYRSEVSKLELVCFSAQLF